MDVVIAEKPDIQVETYVRDKRGARLCHLPAWGQMIERVFGHKSLYLAALEDGTVRGVLSLTHVKSLLFGNRIVSHAFSNYGGPLFEDAAARDALFNRAVALAEERGCDSVEFRNVEALPYALHVQTDKITMHLPLVPDPQVLWKSFDAKVRNQVRKAEKSGITVTDGGLDNLDEFYQVYTVRMRQLGTPCYSRRFIRGIVDTFPDDTRIFVARLDDLTVGAGITHCLNGFVEIPLAATLTEYNNLCPNNLMYWSILEHYCRAGAALFDFGRCTEGGSTHRFKKQWGAGPVALNYQYWVPPGRELSVPKPSNPKYKRRIELWKRLPLWVTRLLGPMISRSLP